MVVIFLLQIRKQTYAYIAETHFPNSPSVVGRIVLQRYQVLTPGTCRCYLVRRKGLCRYDKVKDLKMTLLDYLDRLEIRSQYPSKKEAKVDLTQAQKR